MEELLRIAYRSFMDNEDAGTSESVRIINRHWKMTDQAIDELQEVLSDKLFKKFYDLIVDGACEIQEAAFMAEFSQCAKFITNGKVNFFAIQEEGGGVNE